MSNKELRVWSSSAYSTWDISDVLRKLRVTHTIDPDEKTKSCLLVNMKRDQPRAVHISTSVQTLRPEAVNFIVAAYGMLSMTNIPALNGPDLMTAVRASLVSDIVTLVNVRTMSPVDYINYVAKPSLLNKILTELQGIQPYNPLRQDTKAIIVQYFNGRVSEKAIMTFLSKTLRLERMKPLIKEGRDLRAAVELVSKGGDAEVISLQTGVPAFDIQYFFSAGKPKVKK